MRRFTRMAWTAVLAAASVAAVGAGPVSGHGPERVAPGVSYRTFTVPTTHGSANVHVVEADLRHPGVRTGLLHPGTVSAREPVSRMAGRQGAVAAVNGDFFHMVETQHPGVPATGAPSGPAVADGFALKAAVPEGQRFGWAPPSGDSAEEVFGVGTDGRARAGRLRLEGRVRVPDGELPLGGLNQYALPVGSIGLFTSRWGSASRARAVCGTDTVRAAPCTDDAYEVTVRQGHVVSASAKPGTGTIDADTQILLGRERGAEALRGLVPGTAVEVRHHLASTAPVPFRFALGAHFLVRGHREVAGLDTRTAEPRTAVGIAGDGSTLYLLATDGREGTSTGLTVRELAGVMRSLDCADALYLDGGASSTLVTRDHTHGGTVVRNHLQQGQERRVPNGIAVFSH
ncbi:phosphodiester glycosidase family protein [Streptomyces sp. NPDC051567]|uniref:phosphodiester glycosidase family protein n=1 Tax=Streptomyces sp. NPDC051567 TaxID=3365660 RepID=UPI00379EEAEE